MTLPEARRVFADLMQQAREGKLTEHARARLAQARQILRRHKRPAMNPRNPKTQAIRAEHADVFIHNAARFPHDRHLVELKKIKMGGIPFAFVVLRDGHEVGFITKYRDTRTETHPWKAYVGIGEHSTYLGAAYGSDGKARATQAIVDGVPLENRGKLTRSKARLILHEGRVRGHKLTPRQRRFFGARASGYPRRNPGRKMQRIGRAVEVRYRRDIGRKPGYYKHEIQSRKAGVYTIPPGWVYVSTKSILITEREPRV